MIWDELKKDPIRYELVSIAQEAVDLYEDEKLSLVDALLKNGVTIQRWIPVSERLPHAEYGESDNVLAMCGCGIIYFLCFDGGNWCYPTGELYLWDWDNREEQRITHWMPLPDPPKEAKRHEP